VLLRIYAKCINGQHEIAKRRIAEALRDGTGDYAGSPGTVPPGAGAEAQDGNG